MKYICLAYIKEKKWETMSESEREKYDVPQKYGQAHATTLRSQSNKVSITDGPFAETKEQMGAGCTI